MPDLVTWLLGTGLRIGEALAVSWDEIDLDTATAVVEYKIVRVKGRGLQRIQRTKSDAGERTLRLPQFVLSMLRRRKLAAGGVGPVFATAAGGWRDPSNTRRDLRRARGEEFGWVVPHTFRKTVATQLDDAALSARRIADQLGHARPSLTQDVYMGRKAPDQLAADALDAAAGT